MGHELHRQLYQIVWRLAQSHRTPRVLYPDWQIALVYFWVLGGVARPHRRVGLPA